MVIIENRLELRINRPVIFAVRKLYSEQMEHATKFIND